MTARGQDPVARRTPADAELDLHISAQPGPVFVEGRAYRIPAEVVSALRQMLTRLSGSGRWPEVTALTAALRGEGVSYVALAIGAVLNHDTGSSVCLVDTNWHWPSAPFAGGPGLAELLSGTTPLEQAMVRVGEGDFWVLPAGQMPPGRRAAAARSPELKATLDELRLSFNYVIVDVPAILATSDAIALAGLADACCLVVRQGATPAATVREALAGIAHLPVMGVILNSVHLHMPAGLAGQLVQA